MAIATETAIAADAGNATPRNGARNDFEQALLGKSLGDFSNSLL